MKKMNKKGFTLTELVIVIVIIAILAAVLIPSMTGYVNRAKKSNAQSEASSVYTVYAAWLADDATDYSDYKATHDADNNRIVAATKTTDTTGVTTYDTALRTTVTTVGSAKSSLVYNFAKYYAAAQDIEVIETGDKANFFTSFTGETEVDDSTAIGFYKVGKLRFVAVSEEGFYMISSNDFAVLVTVKDNVPTYEIGDKKVTTLGATSDFTAAKWSTAKSKLTYTASK